MGYTFPVQPVDTASLVFSQPSASGSQPDEYANNGRVQMIVRNDDDEDQTLTIYAQRGCVPFGVKHDAVYTLHAGKTRIIGPCDAYSYNDEMGRVQFSTSTDVNIEGKCQSILGSFTLSVSGFFNP